MVSAILIILVMAGYFIVTYFTIKFIGNRKGGINPFFRILIISFLAALLWGIGIAGTDSEPGFALPAPNIIAITLMLSEGYFRGVLNGIYILVFWWVFLFIILVIRHLIKSRRNLKMSDQ